MPRRLRPPFEERGLEVVVGGVCNVTILYPRAESFNTRDQLDQEGAEK